MIKMLRDIFENVVESFTFDYSIDSLYIYSEPMKAFIHYKEFLLMSEINIRGGMSSLI